MLPDKRHKLDFNELVNKTFFHGNFGAIKMLKLDKKVLMFMFSSFFFRKKISRVSKKLKVILIEAFSYTRSPQKAM